MPTYDYKCRACGHQFEELQSFSEPVLSKCPKCKKNQLERLFGGGGAIIFKGSGFYETDYRRPGEAKANGSTDGGDAATAKPEAKTETKAEGATTPVSTSSDTTSSSSGTASPAKSDSKGSAKKAK